MKNFDNVAFKLNLSPAAQKILAALRLHNLSPKRASLSGGLGQVSLGDGVHEDLSGGAFPWLDVASGGIETRSVELPLPACVRARARPVWVWVVTK